MPFHPAAASPQPSTSLPSHPCLPVSCRCFSQISSAGSSTTQAKNASPATAVVTNTGETGKKANSDTLKQDINSNPSDNSNNQNGNDDSQEPASSQEDQNQQRQVIPRQQQKSTPPRANITNGKTTNSNDLSKQDMSKNGTFAKAYGANGKCSVYQNKSWADNSTSWCNDLYKGEWKVQFDYGLVRGETACDTDGGVEKRFGTPAGKNGQYCWCHVIEYTPNGGIAKKLSLSWMYNYGQTSFGACQYRCALDCASLIGNNADIRKKMFNAK